MRQLLQATATHLPLRDSSVQCIVTSPPYWGLRAYAGEQSQTWGGDPEHEHDWAAVPGGESYTGTTRWQHVGGRDGVEEGGYSQLERGGTCACGAWRGGLGLETVSDCAAWARGEPPCAVCFVCHMRVVFAELWRVLRKDGTCFVNLGDSYASAGAMPGLKPKDLIGGPWRVALALQADGWWLRSEIIWAKPNPMPESTRDRPTKAHEQVFLLTKAARYFYDRDAIREPVSPNWKQGAGPTMPQHGPHVLTEGHRGHQAKVMYEEAKGANARTVWTIPTQAYPGSHFATFPEALAERCVLAGTSPKACGVCGAPWARAVESHIEGTPRNEQGAYAKHDGADGTNSFLSKTPVHGTRVTTTTGWAATCAHTDDTGRCVVLDPFAGTGTVARVALRHGRHAVGIDISREYLLEHAVKRADKVQTEMGL